MSAAIVVRKFQMENAADGGEDLIEQACLYLMAKRYPDSCTASRKRQIRQRAKKFEIVDGEVFYKPTAGEVRFWWRSSI